MKPSQGRRKWFKVHIDDWLEGTTRYQMSDAQRALWIDLLALAGRSRFGGIVCSGKDGEEFIGYPLSKFQGLLAEPLDLEATFALFERTGKITLHVSGDGTRKLYVLFITNWVRYQSEYDRTKRYRPGGATPNATDLLHEKYEKGHTTEVEVEVEGEGEGEKSTSKASCPPSADAASLSASPSAPSKPEVTPAAMDLACLLRQRILENNPRAKEIKEEHVVAWGHVADLMIRVDHRTPEEISALVEWSQRDDFWKSNILSMGKLREKFDQLAMKRSSVKGQSNAKRPGSDTTQDHLDRLRRNAKALGLDHS